MPPSRKPTGKLRSPYDRKKVKHAKTTLVERNRIKHYVSLGWSDRRIAQSVDVDKRTVAKWRKSSTLQHSFKGNSGRPAKILIQKNFNKFKKVYHKHKRDDEGMSNKRVIALLAKEQGFKTNIRTLKHIKNRLKVTSKKAKKVPERALWPCNAAKRLTAAYVRKSWTKEFLKGLVWIDESEMQIYCRRQYMVMEGDTEMEELPPVRGVPNKNDEKVHFIHAVGNGGKSSIHFLPLKDLVIRNPDMSPVPKTYANGLRRKTGAKGNDTAHLANNGVTWRGDTLQPIFEKWIKTKQFKTCTGIVLDNAPAHAPIRDWFKNQRNDDGTPMFQIIIHPPNSPDMNLSEHVHQVIKHKIIVEYQPKNNHELRDAIIAEYKKFSVAKDFQQSLDAYDNIMDDIIKRAGKGSNH